MLWTFQLDVNEINNDRENNHPCVVRCYDNTNMAHMTEHGAEHFGLKMFLFLFFWINIEVKYHFPLTIKQISNSVSQE